MKKPFKMNGMIFKEGQSPIRKFDWGAVGGAALEGGVDRLGQEAGVSGLGGSLSESIKGMDFKTSKAKISEEDLDSGPGVEDEE